MKLVEPPLTEVLGWVRESYAILWTMHLNEPNTTIYVWKVDVFVDASTINEVLECQISPIQSIWIRVER